MEGGDGLKIMEAGSHHHSGRNDMGKIFFSNLEYIVKTTKLDTFPNLSRNVPPAPSLLSNNLNTTCIQCR
jgi:hypothetical protein